MEMRHPLLVTHDHARKTASKVIGADVTSFVGLATKGAHPKTELLVGLRKKGRKHPVAVAHNVGELVIGKVFRHPAALDPQHSFVAHGVWQRQCPKTNSQCPRDQPEATPRIQR